MKFIRAFLATILSIIFVIVLTGGIFVNSIQSFTSKDNIKNMITEIGVEKIPVEYEEGADIEWAEDYLEIPEVQEVITEISGQAMEYLFHDGDLPEINEADLDKIINSDYLKTELGIELNEEEKAEWKTELKDYYNTFTQDIEQSMQELKTELNEEPVLELLFSDYLISGIIIALIVLAILIGVCRWSWYRSFAWIGTSMIIAGGLNIILNILVAPELAKELDSFIKLILANLTVKWLNNSIIVLILGIISVIAYFILKNKFNKSKDDILIENL